MRWSDFEFFRCQPIDVIESYTNPAAFTIIYMYVWIRVWVSIMQMVSGLSSANKNEGGGQCSAVVDEWIFNRTITQKRPKKSVSYTGIPRCVRDRSIGHTAQGNAMRWDDVCVGLKQTKEWILWKQRDKVWTSFHCRALEKNITRLSTISWLWTLRSWLYIKAIAIQSTISSDMYPLVESTN